eukprot:9118894-Alexandrium_andersonii.AAC.1
MCNAAIGLAGSGTLEAGLFRWSLDVVSSSAAMEATVQAQLVPLTSLLAKGSASSWVLCRCSSLRFGGHGVQ